MALTRAEPPLAMQGPSGVLFLCQKAIGEITHQRGGGTGLSRGICLEIKRHLAKSHTNFGEITHRIG